jgi:hypothetical protein
MMISRTILIVGGILLLAQVIFFRDYIFPFKGQVKVNGLTCTCPDESVLKGQNYLKSATPDSLKKFDIDYSEIYVTNRHSTSGDPMGTAQYFIQGKIVGLDRVNASSPWNLRLDVNKWIEADISNIVINGLLYIELPVFLLLLVVARRRKRITYRL